MSATLLKSLAIASGGMFSFGSILIVILLLGATGGLRKALAYVGGACSGYFLIGMAWLAASDYLTAPATEGARESSGAAWAQLGFGALLLLLGVRTFLKKQVTGEVDAAASPLAKIDTMRPRELFGVGAMISAVNVKNLAIFLSALSILSTEELELGAQVLGLAAVITVLCSSMITPIALSILFAERASRWLHAGRGWIERNMRALSIFAMLLFGSIFTGLALRELL
jgi:threonine/homoserine/homoserine lactone efflux protein